VLEVPEAREEELAALLALDALGARIGPARDGRSRLQIVLESPDAAQRAYAAAAVRLRQAGLTPEACGLHTIEIADGNWVEAYQARLTPFRLGSRFVVEPAAPARPSAAPERIVLVPGRAFGTGEHPTTQLCALALERWVAPGSRWVDLGCGTAILALVARRCGASAVLAIDDDPAAVQVGRGVVRTNGADEAISLVVGSLERAEPGPWDGVVCNISAGFLKTRASELAALLRRGGRLLAAGFLVTELPEILDRLTAAGLDEEHRAGQESWGLLVMRRT